MARYDAITQYLRQNGPEKRELNFSQIERLIGSSLPPSARTYAAWWANDARPGRQSNAWLSIGWKAGEVDLTDELVTFTKSAAEPSQCSSADVLKKQFPAAVTVDLPEAPNGRIQLVAEICWKALGIVQRSASGSLKFPSVPAAAGLYRFRLLSSNGGRHYIGESVNVRRRFSNYRSPGPTQTTSLRINDLLLAHLGASGDIAVDVILDGVTLKIGEQDRQVDLADKPTRRLLEQAAIVACGGTEVESMNL